jgi:hypothetical protein
MTTMSTNNTGTAAKVYCSITGDYLGTIDPFPADRYENACDNEEGHVAAGDVLDDADLSLLGITPESRIFAISA